MPFSFYPELDAIWLDSKIDKYGLCSWEITEEVKYSGYSAEQIIDSINPVIYCTIYLIINQLMNKEEIQDLSQELQEEIREALQDSIYTNSLDSHLQAYYIFNNLKDKIYKDLRKHNSNKQAKLLLQELEALFDKYDF